jgi:flagellar biosynthesis GTPase FlhF
VRVFLCLLNSNNPVPVRYHRVNLVDQSMSMQENEVGQEVEAVTPTEQEQAQLPVEVDTESGAVQTAGAEEQQAQKPKHEWVQRRINQLANERKEALLRAEAAEARLRESSPNQQPESRPMTQDEIRAEAKRLVQQERFDESCNKVFDAGKTEFGGEWDSSLKTFQMLGGASPDFLEAITSMDNGHKVLHALGQDPETAERILSLPPLRMALELARLEAKAGTSAPTPKQVSKAPAPITPVGGKSAPVEPAEFASTAEYIAWKKRNKG